MSIVSPERPTVQSRLPRQSFVPAPASPVRPVFPPPCPSWCTGGHDAAHTSELGVVSHLSPTYTLPNPAPLEGSMDTVLRVALIRTDSVDRGVGVAQFYLCGESEVELPAAQAEVFLAQVKAFIDAMLVLHGQMG